MSDLTYSFYVAPVHITASKNDLCLCITRQMSSIIDLINDF